MKLRAKVGVFALLLPFIYFFESAPTASAAISIFTNPTYYAYESFASGGTWTKPYGVSMVEYAVVAGGGRGGGSQASSHFAGGGGGGGGVRYGSVAVGQSSYTITVGAGQATGCSQGRGGNSSLAGGDITTITATGGGSGSCNSSTGDGSGGIDGYSGGSGGGAGAQVYAKTFGAGNAGAYSPVEGFSGGTSVSDAYSGSNQSGGGGGGAGAAGGNGTTGCGGSGGTGVLLTITGTLTYYGGGGGGGTRSSNCGGTAGSGGGGTGGVNGAQGTAGADGFGGGGGGTSLSGGNRGGNGVVILKFVITSPDTPNLPTASDSGASNTDDITNLTSFSLTGYAIGGASIQIYDSGTAVGTPCVADITTGLYSCALTGLTNGTHAFTSKASFGGGAAISSAGTLTVKVDSTGPTVTPGAAISLAENIVSIAMIACNETCTLTMTGGADSASVTFTSVTGVLVFKSAPDYEAPTDVGTDRTYAVTIQGVDLAGNTTTVNYVITITNANESAVLGLPTISGIAYKGYSTSLAVTSNVAGKVRFFMDGKRIPGCLAITTSGSYPNFTATCPWKPAVTSRHNLTASITPTDNTFSANTSAPATFIIQKRSTTR